MQATEFIPRSSINDEYWKAYIDHGAVWQRFSADQRAEIFAMPMLPHKPANTYRDPEGGGIEHRPEISQLLKSIDCDPKFPPFHVLIRLMQVCHAAGDVFAPDRAPADLGRYLVRHVLATDAAREFDGAGRVSWWSSSQSIADVELDLARFASGARLRSFLAIEPDQGGTRWEAGQRQGSTSGNPFNQFSGRLVCGFAQAILAQLAAAPGPLALTDLLARIGHGPKQRSLVAKALRGLCQYVFTIADYDPGCGDLRLGLWPELRKRLAGVAAQPPPHAAAAPSDATFLEPFVCSDIAQILASAAAAPIQVKRQSNVDIFAAKARELAARLGEVPDWVGSGLFKGSQRAGVAVFAAWSFGWLELDRRKFHFAATQAGRDWLALPPTGRLRQLMDIMRLRRWGSRHWSQIGWNFCEVTGRVRITSSEGDILACEKEIAAAFLGAPVDSWVDAAEWLDHAARTRNPIAAAVGADTIVVTARPDAWRGVIWARREAEGLEKEAREMLDDFLFKRLVPFGGAEVGRSGGKSVVFRLTEFGRYYLGARREFPQLDEAANGRVIVQPNFEVMFLGRNLLAEADLAGFCEPTGQHTGAVFRITRQSVQKALHNGGSVDSLLATLRRIGDRELPANVATEISGWAGARRTFDTTQATLLRCPDATVAIRIHGLLPATTIQLSDTILELTTPLTTPQRRKLEAAGLFQQSADDVEEDLPPPRRAKRRRRRR